MIDIENLVFNTVATALRSEFAGIYVAGEYVDAPSSFPAVTLTESSNTIVQRMRTAGAIENGVSVMYELNVYSNKKSGKKAEAKAILAAADRQLLDMGFTRTFSNPVPNVRDATIYRITARYEAVVLPEGNNSYRIYTNY